MANKEIVSVLKIDTGQSENTIKSLKAEIAQLKKSLETAEIGSEEFAKASRDLATAQANLKTVMADGKKTADAVEGSYNHMVATMAELKKQWRATADEAKRNEIGRQIDAINTKLKDMDATIGNHQRNVGNYKGDIIEAFDEMGGEVKTYGERWSEMQKSTEQTRAKFESVQKMASGLASGFAALQGVTALLGSENENLQKVLVKVQAAMAIAQGVGGLKDLIEGYTQAKTAFQGATMGLQAMETQTVATTTAMNGTTIATNTATVATNNFKKALISTGIGALVVALGALIANWDKISKLWNDTNPQKETAKKTKELRLEVEKLAIQSSAEKILRIKELSKAYIKLGDDLASKKKFVKDYAEELEGMGIEMNDVNDAEKIFREKTKDYCDAVMARAKADAARQAATTLYSEKMQKIAELNSEITTAEGDLYEYGETNQTFLQKVDAFFSRRYGKTMPESYKEDAKALIDGMKNEVKQLQTEADNAMSELFAFADAQDAFANSILGGSKKKGGGSNDDDDNNNNNNDDPAAEAKRIAERAKQALIDTKEEELAELRRIYKEELALLQQHNIDTGDLTKEFLDKETKLLKEIEDFGGGNEQQQLDALDKFYKERIRIYTEAGISTVELTAQFEAEKKAITDNYDNQRKAALQQIANDGKSQKDLELQELTEQYNTYLELFKDHEEQMLLVHQWYTDEIAKIDEKYKEKQEETDSGTTQTHKQTMAEFIDSYGEMYKKIREGAGETAANVAIAFTQALSSASEILGAIQAGIDTSTEEGFEKSKKFQIAQAVISMAQGILAAVSSAMMIPPPMGPILGAINAGTVATVGGIQIANIKKQTFGGSSGDIGNLNGMGIANPSLPDMIPINYTRSLMTDTETAELNKGNRVYVVESDITDTQDNVKVKESNSNF